ncbi:MAG: c-type cytochrome [Bauldia sp.]
MSNEISRKRLGLAALATIALAAGAAIAQQAAPDVAPIWAWGFTTPAPTPPPAGTPRDTVAKYSVPGSKASYTEAEANFGFGPADWFPEDHPAMPEIVAHGRQAANIQACSLCHMPNGFGRQENANVSGLPREYFLQTLADFKAGNRTTSDKRKTNTATMSNIAKNMTDEELRQATDYFTAIKVTPWVKVVEATSVPKMRSAGGILLPLTGDEAGTEPLGARIIETPQDPIQTEKWRNSHSGFVAYVPPGAVKRGEALATTGDGGRFTACVACHGGDLKGLGPIPPIAGRSPSYLVRQLYDMQHGNRTGAWTTLMAPVVAKLTPDDLIALAAYAASLTP